MADNNYCACNSGESRYTIKLNQQGPAGKKGEQGDKGIPGFSPYISVVQSDDENYILRINNEANSYNTPNLFPKDQLVTWTNNIEAQVQQNTTDLSNIKGNYVDLKTDQEIQGKKSFINEDTEFSAMKHNTNLYDMYGKILIMSDFNTANIRFHSNKRTNGLYNGASIFFSNTNNRLYYFPNSAPGDASIVAGNELAVKGDFKLATTTTAGTVKVYNTIYRPDEDFPILLGSNSDDTNSYQKLFLDSTLLNGKALVTDTSANGSTGRRVDKVYLTLDNNSLAYSHESIDQKYDPKTNSWATVGHLTSTIPIVATTQRMGMVKPDGTTVTITDDGTISAVGEVSQQELADGLALKVNLTDYNNRVGSLESTVGEQAQTIATLQENNTKLLEMINALKDRVTALETMIDGGNA